MHKNELIVSVHRELEARVPIRTVRRVVEAVFVVMRRELQQRGRFALTAFGTLKVVKQRAGTARNPKTGESVSVPRRKTVRFTVSPLLKRWLDPRPWRPPADYF